jgi:GNAT superfamily N-acetyltransferase
MYQQRLATLNDAASIASLWREFLQQRSQFDPSLTLKPQFDYEAYVRRQLQQPSIYGFLLERVGNQEIVGFLFIYIQDEMRLGDLGEGLDSPFVARRVGGAIGLYVQKAHRRPEAIALLVEAAIAQAEELKVSDIDLLISIEQTGIHRLMERFGFTEAAIQYTKHYEITERELPPLRTPVSEGIAVKMPSPGLIPLRDPMTQQRVLNPKGEQVFLHPVRDEMGEVLRGKNGLPIYPTPLRDPDSQDWVFDQSGQLVVCPVVLDAGGQVKEHGGIPCFKVPLYEQVEGKLRLKRDEAGTYLFEEWD